MTFSFLSSSFLFFFFFEGGAVDLAIIQIIIKIVIEEKGKRGESVIGEGNHLWEQRTNKRNLHMAPGP